MDDFEKEMKRIFLDEVLDLITNSEKLFLQLESTPDDLEVVTSIFRLAHNLKGSAAAVGFHNLKDFTHKFETVLTRIKKKELRVDKELLNLLLKCNDHLMESVCLLKNDFESDISNPNLMATLEKWCSSTQNLKVDNVIADASIKEQVAETPVAQNVLVGPVNGTAPSAPPESSHRKKNQISGGHSSHDEGIRVSLDKIDRLLNDVGELVILQSFVNKYGENVSDSFFQSTITLMNKIIQDLQNNSLSLRMVPLKGVFQKMQRIVRDVSQLLNKEVDFIMEGENTELDKTVVEKIGDPLVHLVRNAIDHGIENKEDRLTSGKPAIGKIYLTAQQKGGSIEIEVRDDGKGLSATKLVKKAKEKGLIAANAELSISEAQRLIFHPGFSTKETVSDISGRGVGMDVVNSNITELKGKVVVESVEGKGSTFRIILPLSLAIVEALVVQSQGQTFLVQMGQIVETYCPEEKELSVANETGNVMFLRGKFIPIFYLHHLLKIKEVRKKKLTEGICLIIGGENGGEPFAVFVDKILYQQQVVIKKFGDELSGISGVKGAVILSDGRPAPLIDLIELKKKIEKCGPFIVQNQRTAA